MTADIRASLVEYLDREFMFMRPDLVLDDQLELLDEGILDSLGILRVTAFLEQTFELSLAREDIVGDNFRDLGRIVTMVDTALARAQQTRGSEQ